MFIKDLCSSQLDKAALDKGNAKGYIGVSKKCAETSCFVPNAS
jgi:hypothetical protein